ncbi:hypothetical protein QJS66_12535 [Kocuria rhizophila]|nr:hypothetical protein QJS66_12535 [Kocuria rhizophila]
MPEMTAGPTTSSRLLDTFRTPREPRGVPVRTGSALDRRFTTRSSRTSEPGGSILPDSVLGAVARRPARRSS